MRSLLRIIPKLNPDLKTIARQSEAVILCPIRGVGDEMSDEIASQTERLLGFGWCFSNEIFVPTGQILRNHNLSKSKNHGSESRATMRQMRKCFGTIPK